MSNDDRLITNDEARDGKDENRSSLRDWAQVDKAYKHDQK